MKIVIADDKNLHQAKNDFFLSLEVNKFNFILKAVLGKDSLIHLKKINL